VKFTIELGTDESVLRQLEDQGIKLPPRRFSELVHLSDTDCVLGQLTDNDILTPAQVAIARKKLLRRMLLVIGGGDL